MSNNFKLLEVGKKAHSAALDLSEIPDKVISETLVLFSSFIQKHKDQILRANDEDVQLAILNNSSKAFVDRLRLDDDRINSLRTVMLNVANKNPRCIKF